MSGYAMTYRQRSFWFLIIALAITALVFWIVGCTPGRLGGVPEAREGPRAGDTPSPTAPALSVSRSTNWPDRRMIGAIYWSDPAWRTKKNPRGWNPYWYGELDAADSDYVIKFQKIAMSWYIEALDRCVRSGVAQGVYEHDPEGSEFAETTYEGDIIGAGPPEMSVEFVKKRVDEAAKRGLLWGCCIRQTNRVWTDAGRRMQAVNDRVRTVAWHLQTLRFLFGDNVRYVYFDTNHVGWDGPIPIAMSPVEIAKAQDTVPGPPILVMGEVGTPNAPPDTPDWFLTPEQRARWGDKRYYTYQNLASWRWSHTITTVASKTLMKRGGFDVIVPIVSREPTPTERASLVTDLKLGCIMLFTATWDAPWNDWIFAVYREANPAVPTPPAAALRRATRQPNPNSSEFKPPVLRKAS